MLLVGFDRLVPGFEMLVECGLLACLVLEELPCFELSVGLEMLEELAGFEFEVCLALVAGFDSVVCFALLTGFDLLTCAELAGFDSVVCWE
jgi:hypothetical protein